MNNWQDRQVTLHPASNRSRTRVTNTNWVWPIHSSIRSPMVLGGGATVLKGETEVVVVLGLSSLTGAVMVGKAVVGVAVVWVVLVAAVVKETVVAVVVVGVVLVASRPGRPLV